MKKSFVSLLMVIVIIASIVPFGMLPASAQTSGYYTYTVNDGKATITDVDTAISGDVVIPSTLGGYPVTCIGEFAFDFCQNITSIQIPNSVTMLDKSAFYKCIQLIKINIPSGVTKIGDYAFSKCVRLAFIDIPSSVTSIGKDAFYECGNLMRITVDENNAHYSSDDHGALFNKSRTRLIQYPAGNTGLSYSVPKGVTEIASWAFHFSTKLKAIDLPNTVTSIGEEAFRCCTNLKSINIPNGVTSIGTCTFELCQSLTSITIPEGVITIGEAVFRSCSSLKSIELPKSLRNIVGYAFAGCESLTDVYYSGSKADWDKIYIEAEDDPLANANVHYNWGTNSSQSASKSNAAVKDTQSSTTLASVTGETENTESTGENYDVSVNSQNTTVEPEKKDNKTVIIFSTVAAVVILAAAAAIIAYRKKRKNKEENSK